MAVLFGMHLLKERGFFPGKPCESFLVAMRKRECGHPPLSKGTTSTEFGFTPDCKFPAVYGERGIVNYEIDPQLSWQHYSKFRPSRVT